MTPLLNLVLAIILPLVVVGISRIMDKRDKNPNPDFDDIFEEKQKALAGIVEDKISEAKDNTIDLEIAVKRAGIISKAIEEDLAKLTPRIESYKDYEAAISQYQGQVESLEDAYLQILNKVDTILKERHTIEKTYKRISNVKTKMVELEDNVDGIQNRLIDSYQHKFNDFEKELYKRFDALTTNLLARDAHYSSIAEQEKEKISALSEDFKTHVAKKEEMFTNQLTSLAERAAKNNIEELSTLFEKSREELIDKYSQFADEVNVKSTDIESRYEDLSKTGSTLEEELTDLRSSIRDRLNTITESSAIEFQEEMQKTKDTLLASLKEEVDKLGKERDEFLDSIGEKADSLEKTFEKVQENSEKLEKDYQGRTIQIETDFTELKTDINERLIKQMSDFSTHIKNVLENEDDGVVTLYKQKTQELNELIETIDSMHDGTLLKAESRFIGIVEEINVLRDDMILKAQDDMDNALDITKTSIVTDINNLRTDIEAESDLLKDKIEETHFQASEILSLLENKKEELIDAVNVQKEYVYQDLEARSSDYGKKLEEEFKSMRATVCEDIDIYIDKTTKDLVAAEEKMSNLENNFNKANEDIEKLLNDTESNIRERLEAKIDLLELATNDIEEEIKNSNLDINKQTADACASIEAFKNEAENYGSSYIDKIKSDLDDMLKEYEKTQVKAITDEVDNVLDKVETVEKRYGDLQDILDKNFEDLKSEMTSVLEETNKQSEDTKSSIVDMLHEELKKATYDFDEILNNKRDEMNTLKSDLEDISHRAENGKEVFERNMRDVYGVVEIREKELIKDIEDRYLDMEKSLDDMLEEKKETINDLNSNYHLMLEDASRNLRTELSTIKDESSELSNVYKEKLSELDERITDIGKDAAAAKDTFEKKAESLESDLEKVTSNLEAKSSEFLQGLEEDVFKNITELRGLVDGAITRYKDEISEIEHHRAEEGNLAIENIEEVSTRMKSDYEKYISDLSNIYGNEKDSLNDLAKSIKEKLEEDISSIKDISIETGSEYLDEYTRRLESDIKEKLSILEANKEELTDAIDKSFADLDKKIDDKLKRIQRKSSKKTSKLLNDFSEMTSKLLDNYETKLSGIDSDLKSKQDEIADGLRAELLSLHKSLEENLNSEELAEISNRVVKLEDDLNNVNAELENKALELSNNIISERDLLLETLSGLQSDFSELKTGVSDKFEEQANNFISEHEHLLSTLEEYKSNIIDPESIMAEVDNVKDVLLKEIDALKKSNEEHYNGLGVDFDGFVDEIKASIMSKDEVIALQKVDKESLEAEFEKFKDELLELKENTLNEEDNTKLEAEFNKFSGSILERLSSLEVDFDGFETIFEDNKLELLKDFDGLRLEIESLKNDDVLELLEEEKERFEKSLSALKEDIGSISSVEDSIFKIKTDLEGVSDDLGIEMARLNDELNNFKNKLSENSEIEGLVTDFEHLTGEFEILKASILPKIESIDELEGNILQTKEDLIDIIDTLKDNVLSDVTNRSDIEAMFEAEKKRVDDVVGEFLNDINAQKDALSETLKSDLVDDLSSLNEEFNTRLESRITHFEDMWSDVDKFRELYTPDIDESIAELTERVKNLSNNEESERINSLLERLDTMRSDIDAFVADVKADDSDALHQMIDGIKLQIKDIEDGIEAQNTSISTVEDRVQSIEESKEAFEEGIKNNIKDELDKINSALNDSDANLSSYKNAMDSLVNDYNLSVDEKIISINEEIEKLRNDAIVKIESRMEEIKNEASQPEISLDNTQIDDILIKINDVENEFRSSIESLEIKANELLNDRNDMLEISENLKKEVLDNVYSIIDSDNIKIEDKFNLFKDEILNEIPSMDEIAELFTAEKENMKELMENTREEIVRNNDVSALFEVEKNKLLDDLDNFKSVIRVEAMSSDEKLLTVKKEIEDQYLEALEKERSSSIRKFNELMENINELKNNSNDSPLDEATYNKIITETAAIEEKFNTLLDNMKNTTKEEMDNVNSISKEELSETLEKFKTEMNITFASVEDVASVLSKNEDTLNEKLTSFKDELFSDMPKLEDISKFFIEEDEKIQIQFDNLREDLEINSLKNSSMLEDEAKNIYDTIESVIDEKKNTIEGNLTSFKEAIITHITDLEEKTNILEAQKDSILDDINSLRYSLDDSKISPDEILNIIANEKTSIMEDMSKLKHSILDAVKEQDYTMESFEEEKNKILDALEAFKNEVSFEYLKKDEILTLFEDEEKRVTESFDKLKNEVLEASPDMSLLAQSLRENAMSIFEEVNDDFKNRVDSRISHFEDAFADPSTIKDFYKDAVNEEVLNLREQTKVSLNELHKKIDATKDELDDIENDKVKNILSKIEETKDSINLFIDDIKTNIIIQEEDIKTLVETHKELSTEIAEIRRERENLVDYIGKSDDEIKIQIDKLTEKVMVASDIAEDRINEKESLLNDKIEETEQYILNLESKLTSAHQLHLEESRSAIDNLLNSFTDEVNKEMNRIQPNMEDIVKEFISKELGAFEGFSDAKKAVENLEDVLAKKIDDMFIITEDRVKSNMGDIESRLSDYQNELINEFKSFVNYETDRSKDDFKAHQEDSLKDLKVFYEDSQRQYNQESENNLSSINNMFIQAEDEYSQKIELIREELEKTKASINMSLEDTVADLRQALTIKDEFIADIDKNQEYLSKFEDKIKLMQEEFEPSIIKLENILTEKVENIYSKIEESKSKIETEELGFKERLKDLTETFVSSFNDKIEKVDSIIENSDSKFDNAIANITSKVESVLEEKSSQFDAIKAHYDGISNSLETLRDSIATSINDRISDANEIIDESMAQVEANTEEKYEKYIDRLNSNLEQTLSLLMKEAKEHIHNAKEEMLKEGNNSISDIDSKISNLTNIMGNMETNIEEHTNKSNERLQELDLNLEEKTNILMENLEKRSFDINSQIQSVLDYIAKLSDDSRNKLELEYDELKDKFDNIAYQLDEYLSDIKIFEQADTMTIAIKEEVEKLQNMIDETKENKNEVLSTIEGFDNIRQMHKDIIDYSDGIKAERESIKDVEEKVKIIIELSDDMKERFSTIAESNSNIEKTESTMKAVVEIADSIESKLSTLKDSEEIVVNTLSAVENIETQTDNIFDRMRDIQSSIIDVDDRREILIDKLKTVEKDTLKLTKNDKKIQEVISKLDQFDLYIKEAQEQSETLIKIRDSYREQDEKVQSNLERAQYAIDTMEALLKNVDKYMFEDGIPIVKPTSKKDRYKGVDSKKEKLIIDLYKNGWSIEQVVSHNNYSREEVELVIKTWKQKRAGGSN